MQGPLSAQAPPTLRGVQSVTGSGRLSTPLLIAGFIKQFNSEDDGMVIVSLVKVEQEGGSGSMDFVVENYPPQASVSTQT